ncbi:hypothetical protein LOK49_LG02G03050 [Camellia lanceoleosa]|uniref:Uncharacterized protein n=1 Tax=Camellia lanceoleosa TaxID=1840588 RepID=A0ACC0IRE2_9ERIC|nr:hypothetical protein LOK49_LG02G03050 [Camellia lanceoleosa]
MELEGESDSLEFSKDSNELGASKMADMMKSADINATGRGSKRKHSSAKTLQNKRITGATALATTMEDLGLDPVDPLLHFGVMLMEVPNNREMVMSIPTDQGIISVTEYRYMDMADRDDLAALDDAMMLGDNDVEMA